MKKPHARINNLGAYAHPPKPGPTNTAKPDRFQTASASPKLIHGPAKGARHERRGK